uniref:Non-structural maintenance of chromosomes element 4 n=1 Tax=Timema cristinae TaxID=61476 RepID=A0A7R9D749_TIMCR|nr:unnamed protein product [Timema cristinae]
MDDEYDDIGSCYLGLYEQAIAASLQNNTQDKCVEAVSDVLYKMNEVKLEVDVFKHVTTDAQIMNITAQSLRSLAEISDTNEETFNVLDLAACWSTEFGNNWDRMSDRALQCFPGRPPVLTYMLGTFEPGEPPAKKRRETKSRNALMNKQKKKPEDLTEVDEDDDEMLQQMRFVMSVLAEAMKTNDNKPLCYFRFVVDPHSFSNTIENIFHTSFMVRDGLVSLMLNDGFPEISLIPKKVLEKEKETGTAKSKHALVFPLDMDMWEESLTCFTRGYITTKFVVFRCYRSRELVSQGGVVNLFQKGYIMTNLVVFRCYRSRELVSDRGYIMTKFVVFLCYRSRELVSGGGEELQYKGSNDPQHTKELRGQFINCEGDVHRFFKRASIDYAMLIGAESSGLM